MWFDGVRQPNTIYVASVSRGKDSTAMLRAIQILGFPLDAICSVDIWATQDIPAELPPMVAFKDKWDRKCLDNFGVPVTRLCALNKDRNNKLTYEDIFYRKITPKRERERESCGVAETATEISESMDTRCREAHGVNQTSNAQHFRIPESELPLVYRRTQESCNIKHRRTMYGFPMQRAQWCQSKLKGEVLDKKLFSDMRPDKAQKINIVHYIGIAADEPERIARHMPKKDKILPLVQIGWDEDLCGLEATYLDMLSPTYDGSFRDGCWFCHNQGINQLRMLRKNYPDLWELLLKWDADSPVTFHADGHTVHDFDKRFKWEDDGFVPGGKSFRWADIEEPQMNFWQIGESNET